MPMMFAQTMVDEPKKGASSREAQISVVVDPMPARKTRPMRARFAGACLPVMAPFSHAVSGEVVGLPLRRAPLCPQRDCAKVCECLPAVAHGKSPDAGEDERERPF